MPYILRQQLTGEVASTIQKNGYGLAFYGVKHWLTGAEAEGGKAAVLFEIGQGDPGPWEVEQVPEDRVKIMNVKLRNDPNLLVFMDPGGLLQVRQAEEAGGSE